MHGPSPNPLFFLPPRVYSRLVALLQQSHRFLSHSSLQVAREDHFAPVKNAPGSATDSPDTARAAILAQGARWLAAAGATVSAAAGVEVPPLVSYAGEGLEGLAGKSFADAAELLAM